MSTAMAVWPGDYWLSDGSLFQYFSFQYWTTNHPGKHTFATSFFACFSIFSICWTCILCSDDQQRKCLCPIWALLFLSFSSLFLLICLSILSSFFFPSFFIWPCSGRWCSRKPIREQSLWKSHLLIICAQSCKLSCALHASVSKCLWVCLNPFPSSVHYPKIPWAVSWSQSFQYTEMFAL